MNPDQSTQGCERDQRLGVTPPQKALIWNFPFRLLHWGFAASFSGSLCIGTFYNPESDVFKYHMLLGVLSGFFLAARILLGFFGSSYARWRRFFFSPLHTAKYFWKALLWRSPKYAGINPGTSLVATAMYLVLAALIYTGFDPDYVEDWHIRLSKTVIWLIGLHLAGLAAHSLGHRDWLPLAMITGKKSAPPERGLEKENWIGGWIFLALAIAFAAALFWYFDLDESTLKLPGLRSICFPIVQKG